MFEEVNGRWMINHNGKYYFLKINLERCRIIEKVLNKPFLAAMAENSGVFKINDAQAIFELCLKEENADGYCGKGLADEIFNEALMSDNGYANVCNLIALAANEDCPFLFPNPSSGSIISEQKK